jgi:hypothetical protein
MATNPWTDERGHLWGLPEPGPDHECMNCGTPSRLADGLRCGWVEPARMTPQRQAEERWAPIEAWLRKTFEEDLARLRPKAIEYGASDLRIMGKAMESLIPDGELDNDSKERAGLEMAIGFYAMGKAARLYGAWEKGREPSEDTWHDLEVYALMARYVREHGQWM